MFDECVDFRRNNGTVDPTTVDRCPNFDLMAQKAKSVSALMAWPSGEEQSHVQDGAEGTDERVLAMAHDALSCAR